MGMGKELRVFRVVGLLEGSGYWRFVRVVEE